MLFISHDLGIVRYLADRVMVMYLGHVVEIGTTDQVFEPPYHPYTEALLSAVPIADTSVEKSHIVLQGDIPSAVNPPLRLPVPDPLPAQAPGAGRPLRDRGAADGRARAPATRSSATCRGEVFDAMQPVIRLADPAGDLKRCGETLTSARERPAILSPSSAIYAMLDRISADAARHGAR